MKCLKTPHSASSLNAGSFCMCRRVRFAAVRVRHRGQRFPRLTRVGGRPAVNLLNRPLAPLAALPTRRVRGPYLQLDAVCKDMADHHAPPPVRPRGGRPLVELARRAMAVGGRISSRSVLTVKGSRRSARWPPTTRATASAGWCSAADAGHRPLAGTVERLRKPCLGRQRRGRGSRSAPRDEPAVMPRRCARCGPRERRWGGGWSCRRGSPRRCGELVGPGVEDRLARLVLPDGALADGYLLARRPSRPLPAGAGRDAGCPRGSVRGRARGERRGRRRHRAVPPLVAGGVLFVPRRRARVLL